MRLWYLRRSTLLGIGIGTEAGRQAGFQFPGQKSRVIAGSFWEEGDGEAAVLREGGPEEGPVGGGGGPEARRLPPHPRPLLLAPRPQARRADAVREELPAAVDQLPAARPEAGPPLRRRGAARHRHARAARQPLVQDRRAPHRQDRQRDQEPLEHPHQEEAPRDGRRPRHTPPAPGTAADDDPAAAAALSASGGRGREGCPDDPEEAGRDHHGAAAHRRDQLLCFPCLGHLAVLLLLLGLGRLHGLRRGHGGVAGAHESLRHGRHHVRRGLGLGRRLRLRRRPVRPLLPRRRLRPGRLALTLPYSSNAHTSQIGFSSPVLDPLASSVASMWKQCT